MCHINIRARSGKRALPTVIVDDKSDENSVDSGSDKRSGARHKRVCDHVRAQHQVRKNRRWVQKAVEFVPDKAMGLFKAVRASLNLKFTRVSENLASEDGGLRSGFPCPVPEPSQKELSPPFPHWWDWWWRDRRGYIGIYRGREANDGIVPVMERLGKGLRITPGAFYPEEKKVRMRPEALGGPHLSVASIQDPDDDMPNEVFVEKEFPSWLFNPRKTRYRGSTDIVYPWNAHLRLEPGVRSIFEQETRSVYKEASPTWEERFEWGLRQ